MQVPPSAEASVVRRTPFVRFQTLFLVMPRCKLCPLRLPSSHWLTNASVSPSPLSRFRFVLFLTRGANPMAWTFSESEENGMVFVPRFFVYRLTLKYCLSFLPQNVYVCN